MRLLPDKPVFSSDAAHFLTPLSNKAQGFP